MSRRWESWLPVSGILFVVLIFIAILLAGDPGDTNQEILEYYEDDGNRNQDFAVFILIGFGVLSFLVFLGFLRGILRRAEGEPGVLSALAFAAGVTSAALLLAANALFVGVSEATSDDDFELDPDMARLFGDTGYIMFVSSLAAAGVMIAAASMVALRTRALPAWVAWPSLLIALALVVIGFSFVPLFGLLGWVLVVSLLLLRPAFARPGGAPAA